MEFNGSMETNEEIQNYLNNWVETQNQYGSLRQYEDKLKYCEYPTILTDEEFSKFGNKNNNDFTKKLNELFWCRFENLMGLETVFSDEELKSYFTFDNYLMFKTEKIITIYLKGKEIKNKFSEIDALESEIEKLQKNIPKIKFDINNY